MEPPECPVCLQSYDGESTVPRVLACGHSACETCLTQLPQPFPHTVRCPACTQLVKYPHPQGPSALPKNIDLLRLASLLENPDRENLPKPRKPREPLIPDHRLLPNLWSHEFYLKWKDWVIPQDAVVAESRPKDDFCFGFQGRIVTSTSSPAWSSRCSLKGDEKVSLVRIGGFSCENDSKLSYSYTAKILRALHQMKDEERTELELILRLSSLTQNRVCKIYGLWYDSVAEGMYMVCANCRTTFQEKFGHWSNEYVGANESIGGFNMVNFAMIGMEICEAVRGLHSEGLLCGGLSITCFTFNDFGHVYINLNEVLAMGRRIRTTVGGTAQDALKSKELEVSLRNYALDELAFISPELLLELFQKDVTDIECGKKFEVDYGSDVWSLACVLLWLLIGNPFIERIYSELLYLITVSSNDEGSDYMGSCKDWKEKVMTSIKCKLGSDFVPLQAILCECLNFNPGSRPPLIELWKCTRELVTKTKFNLVDGLAEMGKRETTRHCLVLGEMCRVQDGNRLSERKLVNDAQEEDDNIGGDVDQARELRVDRDVIEGISKSQIKFDELKGHLDCITGLTVGGGFLFSSSLDKTVQVWSLQDLTHIHTFKGHEYKVMALVFVDKEQPLCISGDSGGGIHIWDVTYPFGEEPIKKLYEQKDWRYSGIHALAISGTEYLYTGSGDKSIKAWSLQDYTLSSVMHGHKSVVSTLAACSGVLYSGSWDGTIRLWSLNDHSPLAILGEDAPGKVASVLALAAYGDALVVAHENGCIKIWRNNAVMKSTQNHNGQIFSICMEDRWLFTGGWDKVVNVQELLGDEFQTEVFPIGSIACNSVVTALLYWHGKLFVGQADRIVKVYYYGS